MLIGHIENKAGGGSLNARSLVRSRRPFAHRSDEKPRRVVELRVDRDGFTATVSEFENEAAMHSR